MDPWIDRKRDNSRSALSLICLLTVFPLLAQPSPQDDLAKTEEVTTLSEAMGHLVGKNLQDLQFPLDLDALVRGIQQAAQGNVSPLSEEECIQAIATFQEASLAKDAARNLQEAIAFLQKNRERQGVISLEEGKIQYEITKPGSGQEVQPYNSPLVRYQGRYLNGPTIPETEDLIDLEETILGFSKALIGMKEGETRTLYIHPDLGYGRQGNLHSNALLIFEVEVIKADATAEAHAASDNEAVLPLQSSDTMYEK